MTETHWAASTDPVEMLNALSGKVPQRKLRLFAAACCRRFLPLLTSEKLHGAIDVILNFADGKATAHDLLLARETAWKAAQDAWKNGNFAVGDAARVIWAAAAEHDFAVNVEGAARIAAWAHGPRQSTQDRATHADRSLHESMKQLRITEGSAQCDLLREIFGPALFRPQIIEFIPRNAPIQDLADEIYRTQDFGKLPSLVRALENAACPHEILDHFRAKVEHLRGCWVIDLLLAKK